MHDILQKIVEQKRKDLAEKSSLRGTKQSPLVLKVRRGVLLTPRNDSIALIAEIKLASPTKPSLGSSQEVVTRAKMYQDAGADMISVVTEKHFFKGDPAFIKQIKQAGVTIPILQKDFVIDDTQIYEAKKSGADALLLIACLVDCETLTHFVELCFAKGIEPVVEINDEADLEKAVATKTHIIAVNARDLETFSVDIKWACGLLQKVPDTFIRLGFSGIHSRLEVEQYQQAGAQGVLVGTSLMKTKNISKFLVSLRGRTRKQSPSGSVSNRGLLRSFVARNDVVRVKICGIRRKETAIAVVQAGADFIGLNFVPSSKRRIDANVAKEIIASVRSKYPEANSKFVGIFQNASIEDVNKIVDSVGLDFIQLHGDEDEDYMKKLKGKIIKKVSLDSLSQQKVRENDKVAYILLDRVMQGQGEMIDVEKAKEVTEIYSTFFSGGLTPENVAEVVQYAQPFAVDVAGGIETDGEEDIEKIKQFIRNAKGVSL